MTLAGRLYPRAWRERYGEEFAALMEDLPSQNWRTVWDIVKGGVAMQVKFHGAGVARAAMMFGAVGGLAAGVGSFAIPNAYVSTALIASSSLTPGSSANELLRSLAILRAESIIEKHKLYPGVDSGAARMTMMKDVRVSIPKGGSKEGAAFLVSFQHRDGAVARSVVTELTEAIMENQGPWKVLDSPSLPVDPVFPNRPVVAFLGVLAGVVLGGVGAVFRPVFARAT